jgi:hypothetical protein
MRSGAHRPTWRASSEISAKSFQLYYGHPWLAGKRLTRATCNARNFVLKVQKNDLKPTNSLKRNFYFETAGVFHIDEWPTSLGFKISGDKYKNKYQMASFLHRAVCSQHGGEIHTTPKLWIGQVPYHIVSSSSYTHTPTQSPAVKLSDKAVLCGGGNRQFKMP